MKIPNRSQQFEDQLQVANHQLGFLVPVAIALTSSVSQFLFTNTFGAISKPLFIVMAIAVAAAGLFMYFDRSPKRWHLALKHCLIVAIAFVAIGYAAPLPSAYMIYMMLVVWTIYFDFGLLWMSLALGTTLVGFAGLAVHRFGWGSPQFINTLAIYAAIVALSYYVTYILRIAKREYASLDASTQQTSRETQRLTSLINNIADGVIAVDKDLHVTAYNGAALNVLDINTPIAGRPLTNLLRPVNSLGQDVSVATLLVDVKRPTVNRDLSLRYTDGSMASLYLSIAPVRGSRSTINGYTFLLRDITREKSLEEERNEFISVVSHELRTPITIAEGAISNAQFIAGASGDTAKIRDSLNDAHEQTVFLAAMINDLATLSRAERGKLVVEAGVIEPTRLLKELVEEYEPEAGKRHLTIKAERLSGKHPKLTSSPLYVREILQNFITNALKYTNEGGVVIGVTAKPDGVQFWVRDSGIGISKSDQEKVFDKFFRSEDYRTRQTNGTGLGLYVTMKLARLLKAEINLESQLNHGSTFYIYVPNMAATTAEPVVAKQ